MRTMERCPIHTKHGSVGSARSRCGLTLVELILALTITAMATVAIAGILKATANTWEANQQDDQTLVSARIAIKRLRTIVSNAKLFGNRMANSLVLWAGDANGNFQIEYSECAMIRYDPATDQLQFLDMYFPPGTPQGDIDSRNVTFTFTDFSTPQLASLLAADGYSRIRTLGDNVVSFSVSTIGQTPYFRTVMFSFRLGQNGPSHQFDAVATMRSPAYYLVE